MTTPEEIYLSSAARDIAEITFNKSHPAKEPKVESRGSRYRKWLRGNGFEEMG